MKLDSELCHVDSSKIIVRVSASTNRESLGSALGEGSTVREAETSALNELLSRIKTNQVEQSKLNEVKRAPKIVEETESQKKQAGGISNLISSPDEKSPQSKRNATAKYDIDNKIDWSDEIAEVDSELKRIGWTKEEEKIIMIKTIGYTSRSRITNLSELVLFRDILRMIKKDEVVDNIDNIFNREKLINNSTDKLKVLGWDNQRSVNFLKSYFNEISRAKLKLIELISFNLLLDSEISNKG